jgi:hypothetical protein
MKTTKLTKRQSTEIVVPSRDVINYAFETGIVGLAAYITSIAKVPEKLADAYTIVKKYHDALDKTKKTVSDHLKKLVETEGQAVPETTMKRALFGGYQLEIRATNTKLDGDKVEAMLRAKGLPPEKWMVQEVSYSVDEEKLKELVAKKKLTPDEVESCRHELKYALQPVKKVSDEHERGDA